MTREVNIASDPTPFWAVVLMQAGAAAVGCGGAWVMIHDNVPNSGFDHVMNALVKSFGFWIMLVGILGPSLISWAFINMEEPQTRMRRCAIASAIVWTMAPVFAAVSWF